MELLQKNISEAADALKKFEIESMEILSSYDRINENVSQAEKSIAELISAIESMKNSADNQLSEYEFYLKKLEKANEVLSNNEKEVQKIRRRIEEIMAGSSKLLKVILDFTDKKKQAAAEFDELKNGKKEEANKLMKEITKLKSELPTEIVSAYKVVRDEKKLPVFVKLVNKNQCSGCGMELPYDSLTKLKNAGDFSECPNCRRILYVQ
jgi:predicted  nucleic acid-binding Zn-ribbon protein